ncbi:MAG: hypothetical protein FWF06_05850 [Symbiobacteriaceae bacterium]|nr:hypothetical protein [Symbiobacteriaceae bacterium]
MSITWLAPQRTTGLLPEDQLRITIVARPKGIRFNAVMGRKLKTNGISRVRLGVDEEGRKLFLQPSDDVNGSFMVCGKANSPMLHVSGMWGWVTKYNMEGNKLNGYWDEQEKLFVFPY